MNSISLKLTRSFTTDVGSMEKQVVDDSDEDLMCQYCSGSAGAFERLYERHKGGLFRYFVRHCSSHDLAEELFQEVWIKIVNSRQSYQQTAKFTTFLYRIAHNRLIDHYRHLSSAQYAMRAEGDNQALVEESGAPLLGESTLEQEQKELAIKEAVNQLPFDQREAFLMQQEGHLSLAEIAEVVGISRETVKSRLRYAMNKLRQQLGELKL
ncbi:RNA polymerase sigma factor [Pleionea sediminis]|uniref:RNA polymerase sigma factor n=1 Tax=Pleionea sediminis TaxID=2569479 RepID=UPI00197B2207|nr:RNA polymerase sigma factor [Pleionea sediminis]